MVGAPSAAAPSAATASAGLDAHAPERPAPAPECALSGRAALSSRPQRSHKRPQSAPRRRAAASPSRGRPRTQAGPRGREKLAASPRDGGSGAAAVAPARSAVAAPATAAATASAAAAVAPAPVAELSEDQRLRLVPEAFTKTGVGVRVLRQGDGLHFPQSGALVRLHYTARLRQEGRLGALFDSSRARGEPLQCRIGTSQLIAGLEDSLPSMSKGQLSSVAVPPHRAYGSRGYPPLVPPDSVVVYEVEILAVEE